jgi:hypothetical protein
MLQALNAIATAAATATRLTIRPRDFVSIAVPSFAGIRVIKGRTPIGASPVTRSHSLRRENVGNNCDLRGSDGAVSGMAALDPPGRLASGVGQVRAEVTGANASAQVIAQLIVAPPDPLEAHPDALADRTARPLGLRREAPAPSAEAKRASQAVGQRIQFAFPAR